MQAVISLGIFLLFLFFPSSVLAAAYGDSTYGCGPYGTGCGTATATPTPNPSSSSGGSSISTAIATFFCSNQAPSSAPNLFQINTTTTMATLYFVPAGSPYDSYVVSFGPGTTDQSYSVQFLYSNAKGAITYQVNQLAPSRVYTFKVRGQNGCKPGAWSSDLTIKTQPKGVRSLAKFYPNQQSATQSQPISAGGPTRSLLQTTPPKQQQKQTKPEATLLPKITKQTQPTTKSFWESITEFFSSFH